MFQSICVEKCALYKGPIPGGFKKVFFSCFVLLHQNTAVDCKITSSTTGDKQFDKSPTKTRHPRKIDLRARYWAFLFDNLRRAVDEIYVTCESDQSVVECKVRFASRLQIHLEPDSPIFATPELIIYLSIEYCGRHAVC